MVLTLPQFKPASQNMVVHNVVFVHEFLIASPEALLEKSFSDDEITEDDWG